MNNQVSNDDEKNLRIPQSEVEVKRIASPRVMKKLSPVSKFVEK